MSPSPDFPTTTARSRPEAPHAERARRAARGSRRGRRGRGPRGAPRTCGPLLHIWQILLFSTFFVSVSIHFHSFILIHFHILNIINQSIIFCISFSNAHIRPESTVQWLRNLEIEQPRPTPRRRPSRRRSSPPGLPRPAHARRPSRACSRDLGGPRAIS